MTARQAFEATLIELNKIQAPSLKLYEFNYLINKTINQYINKVYNVYDTNQQTTDDLRVLTSTAYLKPTKWVANNNISDSVIYETFIPADYLHLLNCVCVYYVAKQKDCYNVGSYIQVPATRLTADSWGQIITNVYNKPSPMKPYYYIHNVNTSVTLPTNPQTDFSGKYEVANTNDNTGSNFNRTFKLGNVDESLVEKNIAVRIGNPSNIRLEIRYGKDDTIFQLEQVQIDYIKVPQNIKLTQEQIDLTEDTSQIMEFPDYINYQIINELVLLALERVSDPRLNTNVQISQSIARPTQQQQTAEQA